MIIDWVEKQAKRNPKAIAIQTQTETLTYEALITYIDRCKRTLYSKTPKKSGTIALFFRNNKIEFITYFLAATSLGWKTVPLDPKLPREQVENILEDCAPDVLVTEFSFYKNQHLTWGEHVVFIDNKRDEHLDIDSERQYPEVTPESVFYLGYTSGTSGEPKGFLRTQNSWTESFRNTDFEYVINSGHMVLIAGSLVHSLFLYGTFHALASGATVYLMESFSAETIRGVIEQRTGLVLYVVPTMLEPLFDLPGEHYPTVEMIISSGAKWNHERRKYIENKFLNAQCIEFYGASELSFVSILKHTEANAKSSSVGRPFTGVQISIRDQTFNEVAAGIPGTLFIKSNMVFKEYYQRPEETARVFQNDWVTAGDIAYLDEDGFIHLVGRANQMIISGGLNVYPEEVEQVLLTIPEIEECAVLGVPDSYWGERIVAYIKWANQEELLDQVNVVCNERLPRYKWPKEYRNVTDFPYTTSGKIARKSLKEGLSL
ncbi:AMP-binding protein [Pseudalkalibacillus decolorationis]|uniref:AMP-binding protein n=1 Tax=Pseudalkalibacillus decolorationis TaxID=163879 RepID=UPI002147CF3B|nr:AMP-binding protein [Pseudalkalibacillus decolorationis]